MIAPCNSTCSAPCSRTNPPPPHTDAPIEIFMVKIKFGRLLIVLALSAAGFAPLSRAAEPIVISGITEPFMHVTLGAAVAGIVDTEFFKEGEAVKQGAVILELNKKLEELEVERRKAVMDQNKMEL